MRRRAPAFAVPMPTPTFNAGSRGTTPPTTPIVDTGRSCEVTRISALARSPYTREYVVNNGFELGLVHQPALLDAQIFNAFEHLCHRRVVGIHYSHFFQIVSDRSFPALLAEHHFTAAPGERRVRAEHRQ